jgi:tetratricopeptide (TPR) repeat protein
MRIALTFILFFIFFACSNERKSEVLQNDSNMELLFDEEQANAKFDNLSADEQLSYLLELLNSNFSNKNDFENWFAGAIHSIETNGNTNQELIIEINKVLNNSSYSKIPTEISYWTISRFDATNLEAHNAAYTSLINHYAFLKQTDSMSKYLDLLNDALVNNPSPWLSLVYYSNKAYLEELSGNFIESISLYNEALRYVEVDDVKNKSTINQDIALIYLNLEYYEKALEYINNAVAIVGKTNLNFQQLNNLAVIQSKNGLIDSAEYNYKLVIEKAMSQEAYSFLAMAYSNYGNLKKKKGDFQEAIELYAKSDSICVVFDIHVGTLINLINKADLDSKMGQYDLALKKLKNAERISLDFDLPKINIELFQNMSEVYQNMSDTNQANFYFKKYVLAKEMFLGDYPRSAIMTWELGKENERLLALNSQIETDVVRQKLKTSIIIFVLVLVLLLIVGISLFLSRRQLIQINSLLIKKTEVEQELELRSKELLTESIKEAALVEIKQSLFNEIKEVLDALPDSHKNKFEHILQSLQSRPSKFLEKDFEMRFNSVYEDFFKKVLDIAPDLTPNEIKICAYLRLNISTKEIAALTNKSIGTIDNARSNIRKKLKIDNNTNLQNFLLGI